MRKKRRWNPASANSRSHPYRRLQIIILLALLYLIFPLRAYAYLDPGTGSIIIQLIIAAIVGMLYAVQQLRNKIKIFFINLFSKVKKHKKTED